MKRPPLFLVLLTLALALLPSCTPPGGGADAKPVIYLYPEAETDVTVTHAGMEEQPHQPAEYRRHRPHHRTHSGHPVRAHRIHHHPHRQRNRRRYARLFLRHDLPPRRRHPDAGHGPQVLQQGCFHCLPDFPERTAAAGRRGVHLHPRRHRRHSGIWF